MPSLPWFRLLALLPVLLAAACAPNASVPPATSTDRVSRFYVDPAQGDDQATGSSASTAFLTLERARDAARQVARPLQGDIEIILKGGEYALAQPLALDHRDTGDNGFRLRFQAAAGEKPILTGARRISGWTLHDPASGIYRASLPVPLETRQLFINGRRALRARSIGGLEDIKRTATGYTLPANAPLASWLNPADIEFVYRHIWTNPRAGVARIERIDDSTVVTMDQPGFNNGRHKGMTSIDLPWYVENAFELLDQPGEWYLDRSGALSGAPYTLFYKPYDWEDLTQAEVLVPVLERLITVAGKDVKNPVGGLTFEGLTFAYTTWLRPSSNYGLPDAQNNVMRENHAKFGNARGDQESIIDGAALHLRYAAGVEILNSRFLHLGAIGVCFATAGSKDNLIEGNTFFDIAANAIQIGDYQGWETPGAENNAFPDDPDLHVAFNRIQNNYINRAAVEYRSAMPIGISFPRESVIAHNEIFNAPYSGIHLGWSWDRIPKTAMGNNLIERNRIQNTMVELADGGALYTLGASDPDLPVTIIRNNWARQTRWGQGFYFDESSSRYEAYDNVIESIGDANIKFNGKTNRETRVTRLYSNKDYNIISKDLNLEQADLSVEKVLPMQAPEHAAEVARIKAGAGLQPPFASARHRPTDAVIYELEEHEVANGAYVTNGMGYKPVTFGYSGMGFVSNLVRREGASITFIARVSREGDYELRFRYSAPGAEVAGLSLSVNQANQLLPNLPSTGEANTWSTLRQNVRLQAGENTLSLIATVASPAVFYADRIDLVPGR